jgi:hypothetical protein
MIFGFVNARDKLLEAERRHAEAIEQLRSKVSNVLQRHSGARPKTAHPE